MIKHLLTLILSLLMFGAYAQKDTSVYYITKTGKVVSTKDQADLFLVILPPDTSVDKNLFIIKEFYPSGKLALVAGSVTKTLPLKLQGPYMAFFANGHKKDIRNFDEGAPVGDVIEYYPNGKFYNKISYVKNATEDTELLLKDCSDSTGKVLATNGNGKWLEFNDNFNRIAGQGEIVNGRRDSVWDISTTDTTGFVQTYKNGKIVKSEPCTIYGNKFYTKVEYVPEFPGGLMAFGKFIDKNLRYPDEARSRGTQGKVFVSFVVERDGTLSGIKVARGIGDGCDEEAVRIIKSSPPWKPGMQNGKPVRVQYSVPIAFTMSN